MNEYRRISKRAGEALTTIAEGFGISQPHYYLSVVKSDPFCCLEGTSLRIIHTTDTGELCRLEKERLACQPSK